MVVDLEQVICFLYVCELVRIFLRWWRQTVGTFDLLNKQASRQAGRQSGNFSSRNEALEPLVNFISTELTSISAPASLWIQSTEKFTMFSLAGTKDSQRRCGTTTTAVNTHTTEAKSLPIIAADTLAKHKNVVGGDANVSLALVVQTADRQLQTHYSPSQVGFEIESCPVVWESAIVRPQRGRKEEFHGDQAEPMTFSYRRVVNTFYEHGSSAGVQIKELKVPPLVLNGSGNAVTLDCEYSLEPRELTGNSLVVKWFHNNVPAPVYQWIPPLPPQDLGVLRGRLDLSYGASTNKTNKNGLRIINPTTELSGEYKCSISTFEAEDFMIKRMIVFVYRPACGQRKDIKLIREKSVDDIHNSGRRDADGGNKQAGGEQSGRRAHIVNNSSLERRMIRSQRDCQRHQS
ncbi:hypothetical protein B566_EDAN005071 [Ephemera danica]|nr:hypothetical protein B566_EDAN005071 [Ephemera danica]